MKDTVLVAFASHGWEYQFDTLLLWAKPLFKQIELWTEERLYETTYYKQIIKNYGPEFFNTRGFGYFSWKPTIIMDAINNHKCPILYLDANIIPRKNRNFNDIYDHTKPFFVSRYKTFRNKQYTHRDCFAEMKCDSEKYWSQRQCWAAVLGFNSQESPLVKKFLKQWDFYCTKNTCVADYGICRNPCLMDNFPEFKVHRWDQSILSILVEKYKIPTTNFNLLFDGYLYKDKK